MMMNTILEYVLAFRRASLVSMRNRSVLAHASNHSFGVSKLDVDVKEEGIIHGIIRRSTKTEQPSPRRPRQLAASDDVQVQVVHRLRAVLAVVHDDPEAALSEALLPGHMASHVHQVP